MITRFPSHRMSCFEQKNIFRNQKTSASSMQTEVIIGTSSHSALGCIVIGTSPFHPSLRSGCNWSWTDKYFAQDEDLRWALCAPSLDGSLPSPWPSGWPRRGRRCLEIASAIKLKWIIRCQGNRSHKIGSATINAFYDSKLSIANYPLLLYIFFKSTMAILIYPYVG